LSLPQLAINIGRIRGEEKEKGGKPACLLLLLPICRQVVKDRKEGIEKERRKKGRKKRNFPAPFRHVPGKGGGKKKREGKKEKRDSLPHSRKEKERGERRG